MEAPPDECTSSMELCNGLDDDCDGVVDGAAAICGPVTRATTACEAGECVMRCIDGYDDCNRDATDGCEADLAAASSCGSCNSPCADGFTCDLGECAELPQLLWTGLVRRQESFANGVFSAVTTDDGSLFVGGRFRGSVSVGSLDVTRDSVDIWLARVSALGEPLWLRHDGGSSSNEFLEDLRYSAADDVVFSAGFFIGNGVVAGTTLSNVCCGDAGTYLAAYSGNGDDLWAVRTGSGAFETTLFQGPAGLDTHVISTSSQRAIARFTTSTGVKLFAIDVPHGAVQLAQQPGGDMIVAANTEQVLDDRCGQVGIGEARSYLAAVHPWGACTLLRDMPGFFVSHFRRRADDGFVLGGVLHGAFFDTRFPNYADGYNAVLVAFDSSGAIEWVQQETGQSRTLAVEIDDRDNIYWMLRTSDVGAGRLRSHRRDGVERWSTELTGIANETTEVGMSANSHGDLTLVLPAAGQGNVVIGSVGIPTGGDDEVVLARLKGRL